MSPNNDSLPRFITTAKQNGFLDILLILKDRSPFCEATDTPVLISLLLEVYVLQVP